MAQNTFDFAHFWSNLSTILAGKQATLTTAQQNAANSGVTAAKVAQYDKDSAVLPDVVDTGAKNYVKYTPRTSTDSGITFDAKADGTVETSGTFPTGTTQTTMWLTEITLPAGNYHFSSKDGATFQTSDSFVAKTANDQTIARDISGYEEFTLSESTTVRVVLRVRAGDETCVFKPMICTAADWAVSQKFVPYCPTNYGLYTTIKTQIFGSGTRLADRVDLNTITTGGFYNGSNSVGNTAINMPVSQGGFNFALIVYETNNQRVQIFKQLSTAGDIAVYIRRYNNTWGSWYKFEGTEIT